MLCDESISDTNILFYFILFYFIILFKMTQFDNAKVQELALKLKATVGDYETSKEFFEEIIETVKNQTWRVQSNEEGWTYGWEYKSTDRDWDLVTCLIIWKTITYQRTSRREDKDGDDDGVFRFKATDTGAEIIYSDHLSEWGSM